MTASHSLLRRQAFSLVEVVIAVGVFAGAIVAIIGLAAPMQRRTADVIDAGVANRLAANIGAEMRRIGFSTARDLTNSLPTIELVATSDGGRVLLANGGSPPADNPLNASTMPGIANRERYFLVQISRTIDHDPDTTGWLSVRAEVTWPFRLPEGAPSPDATTFDADPSLVTEPTERRSAVYFFALNP